MRQVTAFVLNYLLNAAWQVPLLFVAAMLSARLLRRHAPVTTYRLWACTLLAQVGVPALAAWSPDLFGWGTRLLARKAAESAGISVVFGAAVPLGRWPLAPGVVAGIAMAYGLCLLYAGGGLLHGVGRTLRLRTGARPLGETYPHRASWERVRLQFGVPTAQMLENPAVHVPSTLGVRRPCLLLPVGLLERVEDADAEAMFAHECAHLQRRDFLVNLVLQAVTLPMVWHPVLRLTWARLTESREWVCDDLAAQATGGPKRWARSLLRLSAQLSGAAPVVPNHAIGMLDANALERRLMRLTHRNGTGTPLQRAATLACCALLGFGTCSTAFAWRAELLLPAAQAGNEATPVRISGGVMAGNVLTRVNPVYPEDAKQQGLEGSVVLQAVISAEGTVEQLTVVSGPEELSRAAIDAVRQWTYKPFLLNGTPTPVSTTITVNFHLQQ